MIRRLLETGDQHIGSAILRLVADDRRLQIVDEAIRILGGRRVGEVLLGEPGEGDGRQADVVAADHLDAPPAERMGDRQRHQAAPIGDDHPSGRQVCVRRVHLLSR